METKRRLELLRCHYSPSAQYHRQCNGRSSTVDDEVLRLLNRSGHTESSSCTPPDQEQWNSSPLHREVQSRELIRQSETDNSKHRSARDKEKSIHHGDYHQDRSLRRKDASITEEPLHGWGRRINTQQKPGTTMRLSEKDEKIRERNNRDQPMTKFVRSSQSTTPRHHEIEVVPGVSWRLWGAQETERDIACGRSVSSNCMACGESLISAIHADLVVCPVCRTISPNGTIHVNRAEPVIGLGVIQCSANINL